MKSEMDSAQPKKSGFAGGKKRKQEQQNGQDGFTDGKMLPSVTEKKPPAKVEILFQQFEKYEKWDFWIWSFLLEKKFLTKR